MKPVIDHIHMTVTDLDRAERFYDRLLPMLGFDLRHKACLLYTSPSPRDTR